MIEVKNFNGQKSELPLFTYTTLGNVIYVLYNIIIATATSTLYCPGYISEEVQDFLCTDKNSITVYIQWTRWTKEAGSQSLFCVTPFSSARPIPALIVSGTIDSLVSGNCRPSAASCRQRSHFLYYTGLSFSLSLSFMRSPE